MVINFKRHRRRGSSSTGSAGDCTREARQIMRWIATPPCGLAQSYPPQVRQCRTPDRKPNWRASVVYPTCRAKPDFRGVRVDTKLWQFQHQSTLPVRIPAPKSPPNPVLHSPGPPYHAHKHAPDCPTHLQAHHALVLIQRHHQAERLLCITQMAPGQQHMWDCRVLRSGLGLWR